MSRALSSLATSRVLVTTEALPLGLALLALGTFVVAWRAGILLKLGARNIPRRRLRALLIVFGLTLSTAVVGGALGTGDTMSYTVRSLVAQSLGPVDEVVTVNPASDSLKSQASALTNPGLGGLAASDLPLFSQDTLSRLPMPSDSSGAIAGIAPAILRQVTVIHPGKQELRGSILLVALPPDYSSAFGQLRSLDGHTIGLDRLASDGVVVNQAAAKLFGSAAGQPLQILDSLMPESSASGAPEPWQVRIAAVARDGGIAGMQAAIIVPLEHEQEILEQPGWVNAALVANRGGIDSVGRSGAATTALRLALADRDAARQLYDELHQPSAQRALLTAESQLRGDGRTRLSGLRQEAARPEMTDRFVSLVTDPQTRRELASLAVQLPGYDGPSLIYGALRDVAQLSVLPIKQTALQRADQYGTVVTTVFLVLGIFSFAAATALIVLIFSLLAADRRAELATLRALGMSQRQIIAMFLFEGLIYDLAAGVLGALIGLGASYLTTSSLAKTLRLFGFHLVWHFDAMSLLIAFSAGVLLTFAAMLFAAWRVSRSEIVAATRGEAVDERRGWLLIPGLLALGAAWYVWTRWHTPPVFYEPRYPLVVPGALSLLLAGAGCCLDGLAGLIAAWLAPAPARRLCAAADLLVTLCALALAIVWVRTLGHLPTPGGQVGPDAITVAVGGLMLVVVATLALARGLGPLLRLLDLGLSALAHVRAVVRPVAGELGRQRVRAWLSIVMFGLVIFSMVVALTMIQSLVDAYAGQEPPIAGFSIRADQQGNGSVSLGDVRATISKAKAVKLSDFRAIGSVTPEEVQAVQLGLPSSNWSAAGLAVVDDGFLSAIQAKISQSAAGYDKSKIWETLRRRPGTAVVSSALLDSIVTLPGKAGSGSMSPVTLWVRPDQGGRPVKLTIIGVIDNRSQLDDGIYTSQATAAGLGVTPPAPATFVFALKPGLNADDVAEGLRLALGGQNLSVSRLSDAVAIGQSVRVLLTEIVQGFMGLGLVAGVAALGLLGLQSVIERRAQLGTLRALGFTRWQTRATIAVESSVVALAGIGVGLGLGLVLAQTLTALLAQHYPEIQYSVPWSQLLQTAALAWLGSALAVAAGVWRAGQVSPADALRAV